MKPFIALLLVAPLLAACTTGAAVQPIPGSITYGGQPHMKLTKSPPGAQFQHHFTNQWGEDVLETYIVQPDRSLKLVNREIMTPEG
jgi:heme A synthase